MTMSKNLSGFRVTGVYPINKSIIDILKEPLKPSLPEATGLAYKPLYGPSRIPSLAKTDGPVDFTPAELEKF